MNRSAQTQLGPRRLRIRTFELKEDGHSDAHASKEKRGTSPVTDEADVSSEACKNKISSSVDFEIHTEYEYECEDIIPPRLTAPLTRKQFRYLSGETSDDDEDGTKFYGESIVYDTPGTRDMTGAERALVALGYKKGTEKYMIRYRTLREEQIRYERNCEDLDSIKNLHVEAVLDEDGNFCWGSLGP
ncbi:ribosomal RNA large subunit methyltransferase E [Striga asiatica]|uniref:Ribosomal RNA large subunit methyltransferase E n=1 Tax=Striga asiatica TaxID=4170 RepID=A0A5A7QPT1_STRAF|nr:ribosomal RNA large subunit methyltransferase E [Striga asiatica]